MYKDPVVFWQMPMDRTEANALSWQWVNAFRDSPCTRCDGVCCTNCADNSGYLLHLGTEEELAELKKRFGWDDVAGFRSPAGCKLPVAKRSPTCVSYFCGAEVPDIFEGCDEKQEDIDRTVKRSRLLANSVQIMAPAGADWYRGEN